MKSLRDLRSILKSLAIIALPCILFAFVCLFLVTVVYLIFIFPILFLFGK